MNDGQVERAGKVKDIFLNSDYLLNLGIDLPLDHKSYYSVKSKRLSY